MTVRTDRKPPRMVAMLRIVSSHKSMDDPDLELPLQSAVHSAGMIKVVAHRHTFQLETLVPKIERAYIDDQKSLVIKIESEDHATQWMVKFYRAAYEQNEYGIYSVLEFDVVDWMAKVTETHDFSFYNQDQPDN